MPWVKFTTTSNLGGNHTLIRQPDKMFRDVRNSKRGRELSATLMEILISGENHVSNLVFSVCMSGESCFKSCVFSLYVRVLGQVTRYSNVTASLLPQPKLLAEAIITFRLVIPHPNAEYRPSVSSNKLVLHHLELWSIILKTTLHLFMQSDHLNWYMQHHSLAESTPPIINHNSTFNTSQGASEIKHSSFNMELILQIS